MQPARQTRSRRTETALARAAGDLLDQRPFEAITVADIAQRAGVSVGTVYRRFRNKRALLHLADTAFLDDCRAAFDEALADERVRGLSIEELGRRYIQVMIDKFRQHRTAILQVQRHADRRDAAVYAARAMAFNDHVHGRFRALLRQRERDVRHPHPHVALNMAIFLVSAAARDAVWRGNLRAYPVELSDDGLVEELTRACTAYLCYRA